MVEEADYSTRFSRQSGKNYVGTTRIETSLAEIADGEDFKKYADYWIKHGIGTVAVLDPATLSKVLMEKYKTNNNQPIDLYILDHGSETGQHFGEIRVDEIDWKPYQGIVGRIMFLGCKAGLAGPVCSRISMQIKGKVWAATENVHYSPTDGIDPKLHSQEMRMHWKLWYQGTPVEVVMPDP